MTPAMLVEMLSAMRSRVRQLSVAYGVGIVLLAIVAAFVGIALLDWMFQLSTVWRLLFLGGGAMLVGMLISRHLISPLQSKLPVTDIAGRVEKRFPQFEDRLRSAVGFIQSPTSDSPEMQRATIEQAVNLASTLPLRDVIDPRPALKSIGVGAGVVLGLFVLLLVMTDSTRATLLSRVLNPFSKVQWPKTVEIAMVEPIVGRVPAGGQVEVQVRLVRGDSVKARPVVYFQNEGGAVRQEFLTRAEDGRYVASLDARTDAPTKGAAMKVWIVAGDDQTLPAQVEIVPRLGVDTFNVAIAAPPYIQGVPSSSYNLLAQQAVGFVGSGVELTLRFSKPITSATDVRLLSIDETQAPDIAWTSVDERTIQGAFRLERSLSFRVDAVDRDGFPSAESREFTILARPDQLPTAFIENPRRSEDRTADATIPLLGLVEDDIEVATASLTVKRIRGQSPQTWTIPLIENASVAAAPASAGLRLEQLADVQDRTRTRIHYAWTLATLADAQLKPGDVLEYWLSVQDNFELNGERHPIVDSEKRTITIISQEELANRVTDELRQVKSQLEQVKQQHDRTSGETDSFKSDVAGKEQLDEADAAVASRLQQQQGSVASASRSIAERLESVQQSLAENKSSSPELTQMAKDVSQRLDQTVEGAMKQSMQEMNSAAQRSLADADRQQTLSRAAEAQKQASAELADALRKLEEVGSLNAAIENLQQMLDAQRALSQQTRELMSRNVGKSPEQMNAADREAMNKLADEQKKLAEASAKSIDRLNKTADQLAKRDAQTAEAMKNAARQGRSGNVSQSQQQASQQMQQNQQKTARQSQQQAEAGLETMLGELREAQNRKLAELQKKLAELQTQIDNLIRRQSGHNLDNLTIRDVAKADDPLVKQLLSKSGRKPGESAKPDVGRLLTAQGQTERNARDIAKKASDVPDGAEPASRITRAATLMERAAVLLKDRKISEAYEPPQLDALAALEESKRLVDQQKDNVDSDIDKQQREAIRAAYIRIHGEQEKLAEETKRIESARNPRGGLNRIDGVRLGQLPAEQQKLVDEIAVVGKNLAALKSTVYIWANQQIADAMAEVKTGLAASKTDLSVQSQEIQILNDLQAMIDNLKIDPRDSKFENPNAGGGGGEGGSQPSAEKPLPSEAELRLMKSLQQAVNVSTTNTDERITKTGSDDVTNSALVTLGRRQAQLRKLLDDLLSKASNGEQSIGPEPKNLPPLPEEATLADIDAKELEAELLGGNPGAKPKEIDFRRVGDRMARSRARLEDERNAGEVTQVIQRRILDDFDLLIDAARQQQGKGSSNGKPSPQDVAQEPKPSDNQAQNQGQNSPQPAGSDAATSSDGAGPNATQARGGKDIKETAEEWGKISPRLRGPVLESRDETIIERYRRLIEDYTQAVSIEASGNAADTPSAPEPAGGAPR